MFFTEAKNVLIISKERVPKRRNGTRRARGANNGTRHAPRLNSSPTDQANS
jgi:hypothetical protein